LPKRSEQAQSSAGLPEDSILLIPKTGRDAVRHMAEMDQYIDLISPAWRPGIDRNGR
jgi:glutamate-5-semialdehyde dehydrogenase